MDIRSRLRSHEHSAPRSSPSFQLMCYQKWGQWEACQLQNPDSKNQLAVGIWADINAQPVLFGKHIYISSNSSEWEKGNKRGAFVYGKMERVWVGKRRFPPPPHVSPMWLPDLWCYDTLPTGGLLLGRCVLSGPHWPLSTKRGSTWLHFLTVRYFKPAHCQGTSPFLIFKT